MNKTIVGHPLSSLPALLEAWNQHEDLRASGAPIADLGVSRSRLDGVRALVRGAR